MDRIWRELMVLKAMQESDFQAMIVGFKSLKETISSVQHSVTNLEETMMKNHEHQASRMAKIEEAVKFLDETKAERASG